MTKQRKKDQKIADKVHQEFAERKFFRDTKNGMLGGVIAGVANYTGWDLILLRVLFVLVILCTAFFPFGFIYLIAWICIPEAKTASDHRAMEGKSAKTRAKVKSSAPLILRVILAVLGVIGLITFIPLLVALVPITIVAVFSIASATIAMKSLFIAAAILLAILLFTVASVGIAISTALITARLDQSARIGLLTSIVFIFAIAIAATTTGGIWVSQVGRNGVIDTTREVVDGINIEVNETDDHVKIDLGPLHIDTPR